MARRAGGRGDLLGRVTQRPARNPSYCWVLRNGCWVLRNGCWVLRNGCWVLRNGCWVLRNGTGGPGTVVVVVDAAVVDVVVVGQGSVGAVVEDGDRGERGAAREEEQRVLL